MMEGTLESSKEILITSNPSEVLIKQQNRSICSTPCKVSQSELRSLEGFTAVFPSGHEIYVEPEFKANINVAGNLIFGGGIGLLIDAATGRFVRRGDRIHIDEQAIQRIEDGKAKDSYPKS